jgi:50S ribosomal protein L16 3-hydroxylase
MRAPSRSELMLDLVEELAAALPEEDRYADPDLALSADPDEIDEAAFARVRAALSGLQALDEAAMRRWFARFITQYRAAGELVAPARAPRPADVAKALAGGGRLHRHPHARQAWVREGRRARLHANGLDFPMSVASARRLSAAKVLADADYLALDDDGRSALHALIAQGHYHLAKPRRR